MNQARIDQMRITHIGGPTALIFGVAHFDVLGPVHLTSTTTKG